MTTATRQWAEGTIKVLGRRRPSRGGLLGAASFLEMVVRLRGDRPFLPKGVHRFRSFEESEAWSVTMMARPRRPAPRSSRT
jgi:hypothetical protein